MMKLKNVLLLGLFASLLCSCELSYSPETRYVFKSHIEDIDGNALAGVNAEIVTDNGHHAEVISSGKTDANGNIVMVVPRVKNSGVYSVNYARLGGIYRPISLKNLSDEQFQDYTFSNEIRLDRIDQTVLLNMRYENSGSRGLEGVEFVGNIGFMDSNFGDPDDFPQQPYPYSVPVYKNQTIQILYTVFDYSTQTTFTESVEVEIFDENLTYTLNY